MNNKINLIEKRRGRVFGLDKYIALCFAVPFLGMLLAFAFNRIFPFGAQSVMTIDLYHMYGPLISHLHDIIYDGAGGAWSWNIGMGINYFTLFLTNVGSPINALIALFPKSMLVDLIAFGMVLKVGLSGLCAGWFLRYKWKKGDVWTVVFASMYAMCGYMINYYWNIMWTDVLFLLPLCMLGIELLLDHGKFLTYTLALTAAMICNYYIAVLMCIFLMLYYVVAVFSRFSVRREFGLIVKRSLMFALFSVLAAGIAALCLAPVWQALGATTAITDAFPKSWQAYNSWLDLLNNHLPGAKANMRSGGLPHLYSGMLAVLMIPLYLSDKRLPKKERILHALLALFMLFCLNYKIPDFIWHGMHSPNDLPFRYSFCYSMLLVTMAYPAVRRINRKTLPTVCVWGGGVLFFLCYTQLSGVGTRNVAMLVATPVLILAFCTLFYLAYTKKKIKETTAALAALAIVFAELTWMASWGVGGTGNMNRAGYNTPIANYSVLAEQATAIDDGLWRAETIKYMTLNDPALFGFRGMTHFSSMLGADLQDTIHKLGYHSYMNGNVRSNRIAGQPNTPVIDSMLGIKYYMGAKAESEREILHGDGLKEVVYSGEEGTLFQNILALPLVYVAEDDVYDWNLSGQNPFETQRKLVNAVTGGSYYLFHSVSPVEYRGDGLELSSSGGSYRFSGSDTNSAGKAVLEYIAMAARPMYIYIDGDQVMNINVQVEKPDGNSYTPVTIDGRYPRVLPLGAVEAGDKVTVNIQLGRSRSDGNVRVYMVGMDIDEYKAAMADVASGAIWDVSYGSDFIAGKVYSSGGQALFTTVPMDSGWQLYSGGQRLEITPVGDGAFVGAYLEEGLHEIELRWVLPGFDVGIKITLCSLLMLLLFMIIFHLAPPRPAGERYLPEVPQPADEPEPRMPEEERSDELSDYLLDVLGPPLTEEELAALDDGRPLEDEAGPDAQEPEPAEEQPEAEEPAPVPEEAPAPRQEPEEQPAAQENDREVKDDE